MSRIDYMSMIDKILENPNEEIFRPKSNTNVSNEEDLTPFKKDDMPF